MKKILDNDALVFEQECWAKYKEESVYEISFEEFKTKTSSYCAMIQKEFQSLIDSFGQVCPMLVEHIKTSKTQWAELEMRFLAGIDPDKLNADKLANLCDNRAKALLLLLARLLLLQPGYDLYNPIILT